jgi:hypothetical protein
MFRVKQIRWTLTLVGLFLAAEQRLHAGVIDTVVPNTLNQYSDLSLERIVFQNGSAGIQVGDQVYGFIQLGQRTIPGMSAGQVAQFLNSSYLAFAETVTAITNGGTVLQLGPTNSGPNSLNSILGTSFPVGTLAVVYDVPQGAGLALTNLPGMPPSGGATMNQYLQYINANYNKEIATGFAPGDNSFLQVQLGVIGGVQQTASSVTAAFLNSTGNNGVQFSTFSGGLSVLQNNTPFTFSNTILGTDLKVHQIAVTNGAAAGDASDPNYGGSSPNGNFAQPGANSAGFRDNAAFQFIPQTPPPTVPEPTTLALFGLGTLGLAGWRLRRQHTPQVSRQASRTLVVRQ